MRMRPQASPTPTLLQLAKLPPAMSKWAAFKLLVCTSLASCVWEDQWTAHRVFASTTRLIDETLQRHILFTWLPMPADLCRVSKQLPLDGIGLIKQPVWVQRIIVSTQPAVRLQRANVVSKQH